MVIKMYQTSNLWQPDHHPVPVITVPIHPNEIFAWKYLEILFIGYCSCPLLTLARKQMHNINNQSLCNHKRSRMSSLSSSLKDGITMSTYSPSATAAESTESYSTYPRSRLLSHLSSLNPVVMVGGEKYSLIHDRHLISRILNMNR